MADVGISIRLDGANVATADLNKFKTTLDQTGTQAEKAGRRLDVVGDGFRRIRGLIAAAGVGIAAREFIRLADAMTNLNSRIRLVTGSFQQAAIIQGRLLEIANRTRTDFESVGALYARLGRSADELGISQSRLLGFTETFSQALKISGATSAEAGSTILQLSQALASGYLRGAELNAVLESGGRAATALADGLGVPIGKLKELGEQGQLTSDVVIRAIESQASVINTEFSQMTVTVGDATTVLGNAFAELVGKINNSTGATNSLSKTILDLAEVLRSDDVAGGTTEVANAFAWMAGEIVKSIAGIGLAIRDAKAFFADMQSFFDMQTSAADAKRLEDAMKVQARQGALRHRAGRAMAEQMQLDKTPEKRASSAGGITLTSAASSEKNKEAERERKRQLDAVLREEEQFAREQRRIYEDNWSKANRLIEATLKPLEAYRLELGEISDLYAGGFITDASDFNRILDDMNLALANSNQSIRIFENSFMSAFDAIIDGGENLGDALDNIGKNLLKDLFKTNILQPGIDEIKMGIGSLIGGGARKEATPTSLLGEARDTGIFDNFLTGLSSIFGEDDKGVIGSLTNLFIGEKGFLGQMAGVLSEAWDGLSGLFMTFLSEYGLMQAWEMAERWALSLWEIAERWAIAALETAMSFFGFERGGEMTVTRPTVFVAGEKNKAERVRVTPLSGGQRGTQRGGGDGFSAMSGKDMSGSAGLNVQVFIPQTSVISGITEGSFARKITRAVRQQQARVV